MNILIFIEESGVCPMPKSQKYTFLQSINTHGFPFLTALLTNAHSNMVNLSFVWRVPVADDTTFSESQKVIEAVNESILRYHTQTMRQELYVFGRLAPSVKPSVARHIYRVLTSLCGWFNAV